MIPGGGGAEYAISAVFSRLQQIAGIHRIVSNHAPQRAAAVQQGGGATHHFDALNKGGIEKSAVEMTGIGPLTHPIYQDQYATTIVTAQVHVLAVSATTTVEGYPRYLAQQIGGRAGGLIFWGGGIDNAHHHRGFKGAPGVARGGDGHLLRSSKSGAGQGTENRQRQQRRAPGRGMQVWHSNSP